MEITIANKIVAFYRNFANASFGLNKFGCSTSYFMEISIHLECIHINNICSSLIKQSEY